MRQSRAQSYSRTGPALSRVEALRGDRSSAIALLAQLNERKFGYAASYELAWFIGLGLVWWAESKTPCGREGSRALY